MAMDEPESTGALGLAGRHARQPRFCRQLQSAETGRLGPGQLARSRAGTFRGRLNVIKLSGSYWDKLLLRDTHGFCATHGRSSGRRISGPQEQRRRFLREQFFGKNGTGSHGQHDRRGYLETNRGGHDPHKVYAAYVSRRAPGQPTVILAKTVKGYGMENRVRGRTSPTARKRWPMNPARVSRPTRIPLDDEAVLA